MKTQHTYEEELNKLRNLSYRYAQNNPDEIPNFYDKEISQLVAEASFFGFYLDQEGFFEPDEKTINIMRNA